MSVRVKRNKIKPSLGRIEKEFKKFPKEAYDYWKKITPKRSGNAKRRTKRQGNTIRANYPYAERLDNGYSKQAPKGMYDPTLKYLRRLGRKKLRK